MGEEVGLGLNWMWLTAHQPHQATATPAQNRCQTLRFFGCDMFYGPKLDGP